MKFRTLIAVAAFTVALPASAADKVYVLRLADQFPLTHIASKVTVQPFIQKLEERSNGAIKVEHYPAQQLAKSAGMLEAVRSGVADLAVQVAGYVSDRIPLSTVVELPSIGADIEKCYSAFQELAEGPLLEMEYKALGVRAVEVQCTPAQFLTTKLESVKSIDDLKGLKLRAGGSVVELTLKHASATPIKMGAPDIYIGIERGTIDGAIFAAASSLGYKLQEVANGVAKNVSFGSNAGIMFMNEDKFQSLPKNLQDLILEVGREVGQNIAVEYNKGSDSALAKLADEGVNVYDLPADLVGVIKEAQGEVAKEWAAQMNGRGLPGDDILAKAREAAGR